MSSKYALVIGNTEYADPGLGQLTAPGKDAEEFARILKDPAFCGFDDVKVLLNALSSLATEVIDEFFDQRKPDDLLVLYFSGHGVRDEFGSLYLAFKNTMRSRLRGTAVKSDYIREAMDQSRSKRQVVILDCCNSGAFVQGIKGPMGLTTAFQGYGRYVLTASDATQFAWEGDKVIGETDNSLFTHFLITGLEGEADQDGDGRITVDELYDYVFDEVSRVTPRQTPTKSASKQEGDIVLRQITRLEDIKPRSLPDELRSAFEDPRLFVREAAVQQLGDLLRGGNLGLARSAREALEKMAASDDSLRIRRAAAHALEANAEALKQLEPEPKAQDEARALTIQETERERLVREKDEAGHKATSAEQLLGPQGAAEHQAAAPHRTGQPAREEMAGKAESTAPAGPETRRPATKAWLWILGSVVGIGVLSYLGLRAIFPSQGPTAVPTVAITAAQPPVTPPREPATVAPTTSAPTDSAEIPVPVTDTVSPNSMVTGRIIDSQGPVVGVSVALEDVAADNMNCGDPRYTTTTADNGDYAFENVLPGNYCLHAAYDHSSPNHDDGRTYPQTMGGGTIVKAADSPLELKTFLIPRTDLRITYPANGARLDTTSVTVQWDPFPGAATYIISVSDLTKNQTWWRKATTNTSYPLSLSRGDRYFFSVSAAKEVDPQGLYFEQAQLNSLFNYATIAAEVSVDFSINP